MTIACHSSPGHQYQLARSRHVSGGASHCGTFADASRVDGCRGPCGATSWEHPTWSAQKEWHARSENRNLMSEKFDCFDFCQCSCQVFILLTWQLRITSQLFFDCQDDLHHPRVLWLLLRQRGLDSHRESCQKLSDTTRGAACCWPSCGGHLVLKWRCTFYGRSHCIY